MRRTWSIAVLLCLLAGEQPSALGASASIDSSVSAERLHPAYRLPARCFAYVGDETDPKTWKLPYRLADGALDLKRLPAAIQAAVTSYRGKKVSGIPDDQLADVWVKLGQAAAQAGKMPFQDAKAAPVYGQLQKALEQVGRLEEIKAGIPQR